MRTLLFSALSVGLVAVAACSVQEGPAERAGREIDRAMAESGFAPDTATDTIGSVGEDLGDDASDDTDELSWFNGVAGRASQIQT